MPILRTDAALLSRFRKGERDALEQVYWAYVDRVERVVRYGFQLMREDGVVHVDGVRAGDVADLVQETFVRAFAERARLSYDGLRDYGPFLVTITRNLLADRARKRGREMAFVELESVEELVVLQEQPYADEPTMKAVRDYLAQLPADLRGIHEQRYVRGVSQQEAARALGLSRQQVRTLEERLRDGLSAHLAGAGIETEKTATNVIPNAYGRVK
jgi:RNA polymerase sigma factor (sigma-70 family)